VTRDTRNETRSDSDVPKLQTKRRFVIQTTDNRQDKDPSVVGGSYYIETRGTTWYGTEIWGSHGFTDRHSDTVL
jgi:hypothetical protein